MTSKYPEKTFKQLYEDMPEAFFAFFMLWFKQDVYYAELTANAVLELSKEDLAQYVAQLSDDGQKIVLWKK